MNGVDHPLDGPPWSSQKLIWRIVLKNIHTRIVLKNIHACMHASYMM